MKATCYLRIGQRKRGGLTFMASQKYNTTPIPSPAFHAPPLPTALVKLNLVLPDDLFGPDAVADVEIPPGLVELLVEAEDHE